MTLNNLAGEPAARADVRVAEITMDPASVAALERAHQRPTRYWVGIIAIIVLLSEQTLFGILLITPILPSIAVEFHTTEIAWVVTLFSLVGATLSPLIGKLADLYGKKRVLVIVAFLAGLGCLISAWSPSYGWLLAGRALAGLGMVFLPIGYMLIRDTFPKRLLAIAIGVATSGSGVATLIGPFIASVLAEHFGVRSVFWLITAITVIGGLLTWLLVPETPVRIRSRLDLLGAFLLTGGVGGLLLAVAQGGHWGWGSGTTIGLLAVSVVLLAAWAWWQTRHSAPMISLRLLRSRPVLTVFVAGALAVMVNSIAGSLAPMLLQAPIAGLGLSPSAAAVHLLPSGTMIVLAGFLVGWTGTRVGFRTYVIGGSLLLGVASFLLAYDHATALMIMVLLIPVGIGIVHTSATANLVVLAVPPDQGAVASAAQATITSLVSSLVIQVCFAILGANVIAAPGRVPVYADGAWQAVFLLGAVLAVAGAAVALAIPHGRAARSSDIPVAAQSVGTAGG